MAKTITRIPASVNRYTTKPIAEKTKRRVAGYARVSTEHEEQATSYEAQMDYYTNYITSRDDWIFVGMYSDEGITATNTKRRDGFNQMIEDALAGKIDLIITKSVSRFARNTKDLLEQVHVPFQTLGNQWSLERSQRPQDHLFFRNMERKQFQDVRKEA